MFRADFLHERFEPTQANPTRAQHLALRPARNRLTELSLGISEGTHMSDAADVRWLSYAELAEARGIDRLSAMRTVRNRRWEKRKGNDGTIRVAVPRNFLENAKQRERENPSESPREIPAEFSRIISALEGQVEALQGQVRTLEAHNADVRAERDRALARLEEFERRLEEARAVAAQNPAVRETAHPSELVRNTAVRETGQESEAGSFPPLAGVSQAGPKGSVIQTDQEPEPVREGNSRETGHEPEAGSSPPLAGADKAEPVAKPPLAETQPEPSDPPRRWWRRVLRRRRS